MIGIVQSAAPLIALGLAVAAQMGVIAIRRTYFLSTATAGLGLITALISIPWTNTAQPVSTLFAFDAMSLGFIALILISSLTILVLAYGYWQSTEALPREEYPLLLLIATLGASALAASASFITLFLGLETMTLAMIGMIAYPRFRPEAEEAGLKYLVLSGMSSAFVLFGIALIELASGSLAIVPALLSARADMADHGLILAGLAMIAVGAGFKLSVVPFHIWVPDVYAGAPAPSGAYLAVVAKIAVLAVLIRVMAQSPGGLSTAAVNAVTVVAILSMLSGNLLALMQKNIKRILGYSSIAHLGYLLVAVLAVGAISRTALMFYIVMYATTVIAAFGVVGMISQAGNARDRDTLDDLRGLFWTRPGMATVMTMAMLSLAGIPPAIGFIAKMYILAAAVHTTLWILTGTMAVSSVIGLFYYLNIIIVMSQKPDESATASRGSLVSLPGGFAIAMTGGVMILFGVAPQPLIAILQRIFD